jgi:predicted nucleic acid-binding Zn ribbon protein
MRKKEVETEKEVVFTFCSSVCVFVNSSTESLLAFVLSVSELRLSISCVESSVFLNSEKCEIIRKEKKKFLDEKIVIESDVSNLCETNNSNSSSLNESCVKAIEIEEKEEKRRNRFCFEFFVIDFALSCVHVSENESLRSVLSVIEEVREYQKIAFKEKRKEKMSFEIFNQYRESRSISNKSDASLTQEASAKRKLFESMSNEREAASVAEKIVQLKSSTTISSLQALQMLFR